MRPIIRIWLKEFGCVQAQDCFVAWAEFTPGGGALNFSSGRGVRPGFLKCGACELTFASEKGGL